MRVFLLSNLKVFSLGISILIFVWTTGYSQTFEANNIDQVYQFLSHLSSGDTLLIKPGNYVISKPLVVDGDFSPNYLTVFAYGTIWDGGDFPVLLDIKGDYICWSGGEYSGGVKSTVEIRGNYIDFAYAKVYGGKGSNLKNRGIALIGHDNAIHHCEISHFANIGIDGNGGEIGSNMQIIRAERGKPYRSVQNWYIYNNHIHDIESRNYGIHEGAMKLVPMVRGVYIYNNLIENCGGQGIWLDRPEGDVVIYHNTIRNIGGKGIFYEISDDYEGSFGAYILRNQVIGTAKQPIWISASNNAFVIGNYAKGDLPSGGGGMPREIDRENKIAGSGRIMTLRNNHFTYNVFYPTAAKAHFVLYDYSTHVDSNAYGNTFSNNYYVTGYDVNIRGKSFHINQPAFVLGTSNSIANHVTASGNNIDIKGRYGPDPGGFIFSDTETGIDTIIQRFPALSR